MESNQLSMRGCLRLLLATCSIVLLHLMSACQPSKDTVVGRTEGAEVPAATPTKGSGDAQPKTDDKSGPAKATLRQLPPAYTNKPRLRFEVNIDQVLAYKYAVVEADDGCGKATYSDFASPTKPLEVPVTSNGRKRICLIGKFSQGEQVEPTFYDFTADNEPPKAFVMHVEPRINAPTVAVSWDVADGANAYTVSLAAAPSCDSAGSISKEVLGGNSVSFDAVADGYYFVCVVARDVAENATGAGNNGTQVLVDTKPPGTFSITGTISPTPNRTPELNWSPSTDAIRYRVTVATDTSCSPAKTIFEDTVTGTKLTPRNALADGNYFICAKAFDVGGLATFASNNGFPFEVDTTPSYASFGAGSTIPIGVSSVDGVIAVIESQGATHYRFKVGSTASTSCDESTGYSVNQPINQNLSFNQSGLSIPDGGVVLCVLAVDAAQNVQPRDRATRANWIRDKASPTITLGTLPPQLCGPKSCTGITFAIRGTASDAIGLAGLSYSATFKPPGAQTPTKCLVEELSSFKASACPTIIPIGAGTTSSFIVAVPMAVFREEGTYDFTIRAIDGAGNTTQRIFSMAWDTSPPVMTRIARSRPELLLPSPPLPFRLDMDFTSTGAATSEIYLTNGVIAAPTADDPNWELLPSATAQLRDFPFARNHLPDDLLICAWLKDSVGNISTPGSPAEEEGKSCFRFYIPTIDGLLATNDPNPNVPPTPEQLQTSATKKDVYIIWHAKDQDSRTPLKMKADFSLNGSDFTLIQDNLTNSVNGTTCTLPTVTPPDVVTDYGCFKWTTGVPINETFEVRVKVTDTDGLSASAKGPKLNDPPAPPSPP